MARVTLLASADDRGGTVFEESTFRRAVVRKTDSRPRVRYGGLPEFRGGSSCSGRQPTTPSGLIPEGRVASPGFVSWGNYKYTQIEYASSTPVGYRRLGEITW